MSRGLSNHKETIDKSHKSDPTPIYQVQNRLLELGKEALEENGEWVLLHRKKTLKLSDNKDIFI